MSRIQLSTGVELDVQELSSDEFFAWDVAFSAEPVFSDDYSFEDYISEKRTTEKLLRESLARRWTERDDFEVADDENIAFSLCGNIYTTGPLCREYLEILHELLQATKMRQRWMFDTSIEFEEPVDGMHLCLFRLHKNLVLVNTDDTGQFDFVKWFSRSLMHDHGQSR